MLTNTSPLAAVLQGTGQFAEVGAEDWTRPTIASWRHSNLVGVLDPWFVMFKWNPKLWYKVTREIVTLERMHRAFDRGLMEYGLMRGTKAPVPAAKAEQQQQAAPESQQAPAAAAAGVGST
jgi:MPBQ/MSBQ methyltransferase